MTIQITEVRNAVYTDINGSIDCEINHPEFGWIPYTLRDDDADTTINNSDLKTILGSNIAAYGAPTQAELDAEAAQNVRGVRDNKLADEVDPIAGNTLRWSDLTDEQRAAWAQYRTDLLNVPQQDGFPHNVTWPTRP
ncbi:MAG: phage tail assembly chaperone [Porticoccaceae bacterium]